MVLYSKTRSSALLPRKDPDPIAEFCCCRLLQALRALCKGPEGVRKGSWPQLLERPCLCSASWFGPSLASRFVLVPTHLDRRLVRPGSLRARPIHDLGTHRIVKVVLQVQAPGWPQRGLATPCSSIPHS